MSVPYELRLKITRDRERRKREAEERGPTLAKRCACDKPSFYDDEGETKCLMCARRRP